MLKCSKNSEGTAELEEALATVLDIIKSVNDSMHQIAITGYEVSLTVALTRVLTHPVFLSALAMLCPWLVRFAGAWAAFLKDATLWHVVVTKTTCQHTGPAGVEVRVWGGSGTNAGLLSSRPQTSLVGERQQV